MKHLIGLAMGTLGNCEPAYELHKLKEHGFDATFTGWKSTEQVAALAEMMAKEGLRYDCIHAPFGRAADYWKEGEAGDAAERELCDCVDSCAAVGVDRMVSHPFIGFRDHSPTEIGVIRYRRVADYAGARGVKVCIENVEGEEYLDRLMTELRDHPAIGFCFDSGHHLCYNRGRDLLSEFGDRLSYLHIDSNLGVTGEELTWLDDSHLPPFDGLSDMNYLASHLRRLRYDGVLMMELARGNRPDRHTHDRYLAMTDDEYLAEVHDRVCRLREMVDGE